MTSPAPFADPPRLSMIGAPAGGHSSSLRAAASAPPLIRAAPMPDHCNLTAEKEVEPGVVGADYRSRNMNPLTSTNAAKAVKQFDPLAARSHA